MTHVEHEPRSFAPRRRRLPKDSGGEALSKLGPPPENPTIADAIRVSYQVHECVEQHRADDRRDHATVRKAVSRGNARMAKIEKRQEEVATVVAGLARVVGVDAQTGEVVHRKPMFMGRVEFLSTLSGAVFALFLVVQVGNALWPAISLGAQELWSFVLQQPVAAAPHQAAPPRP